MCIANVKRKNSWAKEKGHIQDKIGQIRQQATNHLPNWQSVNDSREDGWLIAHVSIVWLKLLHGCWASWLEARDRYESESVLTLGGTRLRLWPTYRRLPMLQLYQKYPGRTYKPSGSGECELWRLVMTCCWAVFRWVKKKCQHIVGPRRLLTMGLKIFHETGVGVMAGNVPCISEKHVSTPNPGDTHSRIWRVTCLLYTSRCV